MKNLLEHLENVEEQIRKTKTSRFCLYQVRDRIEYLITFGYFLSLREKIKKTVRENYYKLEPLEPIVKYDDYGFVEYDFVSIYNVELQPMIDEYIRKVETEIESNNLKLAL